MLAQITNNPSWLRFLAQNKDGFSTIESVMKCLAILIAGYWTYLVFIRKREKFPRAKVTHTIAFWDLSETQRILRVTLSIENLSEVLLRLFVGRTWIQAMKPWPEQAIADFKQEQDAETQAAETDDGPTTEMLAKGTEIRFPIIAERQFRGEKEIEPKESDDLIMDFVIDRSNEQVLVYSFIENESKPGRHLTWSISSVVNFKELTEAPGSAIKHDEAEGQAKQKIRPETRSKRAKQ